MIDRINPNNTFNHAQLNNSYYNLAKDGVFHRSVSGNIDFSAHLEDGAFYNPSSAKENQPKSFLQTLFEKGLNTEG